MRQFLVIQTAFLGDVVLATAIVESLHKRYPDAAIDMLVRDGNQCILENHPFLRYVLVWDKKKKKYQNLYELLKTIRSRQYDSVINVQRYAATGFLTVFSGAKERIGFDKNPWSPFFSKKIPHLFSSQGRTIHEIERNQALISDLAGTSPEKPRLYPSSSDREKVIGLQKDPYICIAPASVWFTKQYPAEKWASFINGLQDRYMVYMTGAPSDRALNTSICRMIDLAYRVKDLSGEISMLSTVALMEGSRMNYVNDSAPMHFASAVNAPVTAIYCSTLPSFGYAPLSDERRIVESPIKLPCRPCGLHGKKACPEGHFRCAMEIMDIQLLQALA